MNENEQRQCGMTLLHTIYCSEDKRSVCGLHLMVDVVETKLLN